MVGMERIELTPGAPKAPVLPLDYIPKWTILGPRRLLVNGELDKELDCSTRNWAC